MSLRLYVIATFMLCAACTSKDPARTPEAGPMSVSKSADTLIYKAFGTCVTALKAFSKNPTTAAVPHVTPIHRNGELYVFDWGHLSGLTFQNNFGAMLNTTASCAVNRETVISLIIDGEPVDLGKMSRSMRDAGLSTTEDQSSLTLTPELSESSWSKISDGLIAARLRTYLLKRIYYHKSENAWEVARFQPGPFQLATGSEADEFRCDGERATVTFSVSSMHLKSFATKAQATETKSNAFQPSGTYPVSLNYCKNAGFWLFAGGTYKSDLRILGDKRFKIDPEESDGMPTGSILSFVRIGNGEGRN